MVWEVTKELDMLWETAAGQGAATKHNHVFRRSFDEFYKNARF